MISDYISVNRVSIVLSINLLLVDARVFLSFCLYLLKVISQFSISSKKAQYDTRSLFSIMFKLQQLLQYQFYSKIDFFYLNQTVFCQIFAYFDIPNYINCWFIYQILLSQFNKITMDPQQAKKSFFRTRQKSKDILQKPQQKRVIPSLKQYIRQFPLDIPEEVMVLLNNYGPILQSFQQNLEKLKLYKAGLGALIESSWLDFMEYVKLIVVKMHKKMEKSIVERQDKINQLLNINSKYQGQKQALKEKIQTLEHLRELQNAQLTMANQQLQLVSKEMIDIYSVLKNDMGNVIGYLGALQQNRAKKQQKQSDQIYTNLQGLSTLLNGIDKQHIETGKTLNTMRELIKVMAKTTKISTGTQVDQSQLHSKAANIFNKTEDTMPFDAKNAANINLPNGNQQHIIEKLKVEQREAPHQIYKPKIHLQKPWALTPTLLVFLQNMSKQNESGRVLPYQYVKELIEQIYKQRVAMEQQMIQGQVGNSMLFDEFVVHFFLRKYRIRRLAEVKLLQFIISLKYYSKFWTKVQTFCYLLDVMKYQPTFQVNDTNNYKFDYYTQNFFFTVYQVISTIETHTQQDQTVYIPLKKVKKIMKTLLYFTDDLSRSRLFVKMEKQIRVFDKVDHTDFDLALILFIDQYFAVRKKNSNLISKAFTKAYEQIQGYMSVDEMLGIFTQLGPIYKAGSDMQMPYKYPVDSQLQLSKLYLFSITSFKNNYQINGNSFIQACQRYGFDAPFPFIHVCSKKKKDKKQQQQLFNMKISSEMKQSVVKNPQETPQKRQNQNLVPRQQEIPIQNKTPTVQKSINLQRIDIGSKLFSQHFALLRQLKQYVDIFKSTLIKQKDPQELWKSFNQISLVLERGCQFMKFPLMAKS